MDRRHTLLVVDDEVDVLESIRHLFHRSYRVLTAERGEDALEILDQEDVHLILSDQRMPGMTGDNFLERARRLCPDSVRMLFTGYADIRAVIDAVNKGFIFRYIHKPWDSRELETVLRQAAEYHDLMADRKRLCRELASANEELTAKNQELAEADQLKTAFLEVASHEFNTPITLILGLGELLRLQNPDREPEERAILDELVKAAKHLTRLVSNTLTLMSAEDFRRSLRPAPVDLGVLLRSVTDQVLPFVRARTLDFRIRIEPDLGTFAIDGDKVSAAIINLLTNAIKFSPDGSTFELNAYRDGPEQAVVEVVDHGIGVDEKTLRQLFQPLFTEFDPRRHSSGDFGFGKRGLGVGLSIVKLFIEMHGGSVQAIPTEPEGRGLTVRVVLPRHGRQSENAGIE